VEMSGHPGRFVNTPILDLRQLYAGRLAAR
jgi:hypothetical protein